MLTKFVYGVLALSLLGSEVSAQQAPVSSQCPPGSADALGMPDNTRISQDACQKAIDLFQYVAPQLGLAVTGGSAILGRPAPAGGFGHFSLGVRGNVFRGHLPEIANFTPSAQGAQSTTYTLRDQVLGLPTADLSVGLTKGISLGVVTIGSLDALVSASYLPEYNSNDIDITVSGSSLKLGYGARLGIIKETPFIPGVAVSYLTRGIPTTSLTARSGGDELSISNFDIDTRSWRLESGKKILFFGLGAGIGQDRYRTAATASVNIAPRALTPGAQAGPFALSQSLTRTNIFGSAWVGLFGLRLAGEVGRTQGGSISTYNQFAGTQADAARTYGSVGLSLGR